MKKRSIHRRLNPMTGSYSSSLELVIPIEMMMSLLFKEKTPDTSSQIKKQTRGALVNSTMIVWLNKRHNIEMKLLSKDFSDIIGIFATCLIRQRGGSLAITIPYSVREVFQTLGKQLKHVKMFINNSGNIELEPIFAP